MLGDCNLNVTDSRRLWFKCYKSVSHRMTYWPIIPSHFTCIMWPFTLFCTMYPVLHVCYFKVQVATLTCIEISYLFLIIHSSDVLSYHLCYCINSMLIVTVGGASRCRSTGHTLPLRGHCFTLQLTRQGLWCSQVCVQATTSPGRACGSHQYEWCWRCRTGEQQGVQWWWQRLVSEASVLFWRWMYQNLPPICLLLDDVFTCTAVIPHSTSAHLQNIHFFKPFMVFSRSNVAGENNQGDVMLLLQASAVCYLWK
jgi:hypothetical protein